MKRTTTIRSRTILVTAVAGPIGHHTIRELIHRRATVRAMMRTNDRRTTGLRADGVDVVLGDMLDLDSLRAAMEGVSAACFDYPLIPGLIDATAYFAQAAQEAGVSTIVNLSQSSAQRNATNHRAREHWISERLLDWSGVPVTHLRPTLSAQWLLLPWVRHDIIANGLIRLPCGHGRHAPIAAEDQARAIATILTNPAPHAGKTYSLFGSVEMDLHGIAKAVGEALGRTVIYTPIELGEFQERLHHANLHSPAIQDLCMVVQGLKDGLFSGTNDHIKTLTGAPPITVQSFVKAHFPNEPGLEERNIDCHYSEIDVDPP
jgi:uncharacterized protein YbjT (DUF2867 family)